MTYSELIEKIKNDTTGIAKGYDISFLQDKFVHCYPEKAFDALMARDLEMFKVIEKELLEAKEPKDGDFVEYDGEIARICSTLYSDTFQLSNTIGIYVSKGGYTQASGCTWDPNVKVEEERLKSSNLTPTGKTQKGLCWAFSDGEAGGRRGVYFEINFKVWSLGELA